MLDEIEQLRATYFDVVLEFEEDRENMYWQGKKDGIRTALSLLDSSRDWESLNNSSPNKRATQLEALSFRLKYAAESLANILESIDENDKRGLGLMATASYRNWLRGFKSDVESGMFDLLESVDYTPPWPNQS